MTALASGPSNSRQSIPTEAWQAEGKCVDESTWTLDGEGWSSWNAMSPEKEFCEFAVALIALVRPGLVIETGVGQGYLTRRVLTVTPGRYIGYESDDALRSALRELDVWTDAAQLAGDEEPPAKALAGCDLAILDSAPAHRAREIARWREHAPAGAYVLVHDARPDHPVEGAPHRKLASHCGDAGVFLGNPRGCWLHRKPPPT